MNDTLKNLKPVAWRVRHPSFADFYRKEKSANDMAALDAGATVDPLFDRSALDAAFAAGFAECRERAKVTCACLPPPFAGFQFNSGWNSWEQVIPSAIGQEGVVSAYSAGQIGDWLEDAIAALQPAEQKEAT